MLNLTHAIVWQLIIIGVLAVIAQLTLRLWCRNRLKSKGSVTNFSKIEMIVLSISSLVVAVPLTEELLFRAPLLLFFSEMNKLAWTAILVQAVIFGFLHRKTYKLFAGLYTAKNQRFFQKSLMIKAGLLGILLGWLTIKTQALWIPILIHAFFNLMLGGLGIIAILVCLVWLFVIGSDFLKRKIKREK